MSQAETDPGRVQLAPRPGWSSGRTVTPSSHNHEREGLHQLPHHRLRDARDAAGAAAKSLGHEVIRAEDFGASSSSPQQACLAAVRAADVVVLVLGQRDGAIQGSGRSATHEEYLEARESRPVLAFIEADIEPDSDHARFIAEVQAWERGRFTEGFRSASDLQASVTQGRRSGAR